MDSQSDQQAGFDLVAFSQFTECARSCTDIDVLSQKVVEYLDRAVRSDYIYAAVSDDENAQSPLFVITSLANVPDNQINISQLNQTILRAQQNAIGQREPITIICDNDLRGVAISILTNQGLRFSIFLKSSSSTLLKDDEQLPFFRLLANLLSITLDKMTIDTLDVSNLKNIITAKQEWETSIDYLAQLVCFVGADGTVLRANKMLEEWYGGDVRAVRGKTVHQALHPDCQETDCELVDAWDHIWLSIHDSDTPSAEIYDHIIGKNLNLSIRRSVSDEAADPPNASGAVLIVQDISDSLWDKYLLESYSQELFTQIQTKNLKLAEVSQHLEAEKSNHHKVRESLMETETKLQSLSSQLLTAHEEERKRIAGELHDSIGQSLSVVKLKLQGVNQRVGAEELERRVNSLLSVVDHTIDEVRRISMGLRPSILDDLGLKATLQWFLRNFRETFTDIQLDADLDIDDSVLTDTQKVVLFRITQEALNNIIKHAGADQVYISVTADSHSIDLHIEDNGTGFSHGRLSNPSGFGLSSMRERAKLSGGELVISSEQGGGTLIKGVWNQMKGGLEDAV